MSASGSTKAFASVVCGIAIAAIGYLIGWGLLPHGLSLALQLAAGVSVANGVWWAVRLEVAPDVRGVRRVGDYLVVESHGLWRHVDMFRTERLTRLEVVKDAATVTNFGVGRVSWGPGFLQSTVLLVGDDSASRWYRVPRRLTDAVAELVEAFDSLDTRSLGAHTSIRSFPHGRMVISVATLTSSTLLVAYGVGGGTALSAATAFSMLHAIQPREIWTLVHAELFGAWLVWAGGAWFLANRAVLWIFELADGRLRVVVTSALGRRRELIVPSASCDVRVSGRSVRIGARGGVRTIRMPFFVPPSVLQEVVQLLREPSANRPGG